MSGAQTDWQRRALVAEAENRRLWEAIRDLKALLIRMRNTLSGAPR